MPCPAVRNSCVRHGKFQPTGADAAASGAAQEPCNIQDAIRHKMHKLRTTKMRLENEARLFVGYGAVLQSMYVMASCCDQQGVRYLENKWHLLLLSTIF